MSLGRKVRTSENNVFVTFPSLMETNTLFEQTNKITTYMMIFC